MISSNNDDDGDDDEGEGDDEDKGTERDNEQRHTMKGETRDSTTGLVYGFMDCSVMTRNNS